MVPQVVLAVWVWCVIELVLSASCDPLWVWCVFSPGKGPEPSAEPADVACQLPKPVMAYIERDNANFEDWIQDIVLTQVCCLPMAVP